MCFPIQTYLLFNTGGNFMRLMRSNILGPLQLNELTEDKNPTSDLTTPGARKYIRARCLKAVM